MQAEQIEIDPSFSVSPEQSSSWLASRLRGPIPLEELDGRTGMVFGETTVFTTSNAYLAPKYGVVMNSDGMPYPKTDAQARFVSPDLSAVPSPVGSAATQIGDAAVFMPWGANYNYGHFLIDSLSGVIALERSKCGYPLVAPPLNDWQRALLAMLDKSVLELSDDLVYTPHIAWSNCMDHYLHWPNKTLMHLSDRLKAATVHKETPSRIYISRSRIDDKRRMVNEAELERALEREGFWVAHPQEMSIPDQASLFMGADVVVSATGAQLANIVFMREGASVVELCPTNYSGIWTRNISHLLGVNWFCHYFPSPIKQISDYSFTYAVHVASAVEFASERVGASASGGARARPARW